MSIETLGTFAPDNLIAGVGVGIKVDHVTIASGASLKRGSLLSKSADTGKCGLIGSNESVYAVLADDVDASSADAVAEVYIAGEFSIEHCIAGTGVSIASLVDGARDLNIYLVHTK